MFKTQVKWRVVSLSRLKHFFYGVILRPDKGIEHRKLPSIFIYLFFHNNMEKVQSELVLFSMEKARALHLTSFYCLYSYRQ